MRALHAEQVEKHERMSNPLVGLKRVWPPRQMVWYDVLLVTGDRGSCKQHCVMRRMSPRIWYCCAPNVMLLRLGCDNPAPCLCLAFADASPLGLVTLPASSSK